MKGDSDKAQIKTALKEFSDETTLHGVRYLAKTDYAVYLRCVWLLVILGMMSAYGVIVSNSIQAYLRHETVTSIQTVWNETLDFPTITVCNLNLLSMTYSKEHFFSLVTIFDDTQETDKSESHPYNITLKELFRKGMLSTDEIFTYCKWINKDISCNDYIGTVETNFGLCFYFPQHDLRKRMPADFIVAQPGPDFGLTIEINTHQEEYLMAPYSNGAGVKVLTHDPNQEPMPMVNGRLFSPGFQYDVTIMRKEVDRLSKPYAKSECIESASYSYESCLFDCQNRIRYGKCHCSPVDNGMRPCTLADLFTCTNYDMEEYYKGECHCLPSCSTVQYTNQVSSVLFPSDLTFRKLQRRGLNKTLEEFQKNNLVIKIFYGSMEYVSEVQKPAMSWDQLIADIGGQLGLFLGASFMTIVEALDLFYRCMCIFFCRRHKE